ncbi:MAG: LytTR family DNA-binding domain-containing protein [Acidobacteriota bacterium]|nr:LytTR family DNA-binding domain-containing protein [Acidobacteriota bacterium]
MSQALLRDAGQPIRAIVVDDEPPARQWLGSLLRNEESVDVVEECGDGFAALDAIARHRPDLVLLDVEMPGMSGFDLVQLMGKGVSPVIVFVTAFDQYAVRAFDVRAIDYLLKPVDPERLREAVRRAVGQIRHDAPATAEPRSAPPAGRRFPEWLLIKSDGRSRFVRVRDIDWIESQKNDVVLHVGTAEYLYHLSTSGIEAKLDPSRFLRIHRSTIVSVDRIKDLYPLFNGDYGVTLKDGTTLTMSSTYRRRLAAFRDGML